MYQLIIPYKVKAKYLLIQVFATTVCDVHGVRFGVKIENIYQIIRNSFETSVSQISQPCNNNKWSEASFSTLLEAFVGDKKSVNIGMSEFYISVVSKVGTEFCEACYYLEGEFPFIMSQYINILGNSNIGYIV